MNISLYIDSAMLGLLGLIFSLLLQLKSQRDKARVANLQFSVSGFFADEGINIAIAVVVLIIALYLIAPILGWKPGYLWLIRPAFLPVGYMGTDILLKLFGVVNKRLNAQIDAKTTIADAATGNLDSPTPATKP